MAKELYLYSPVYDFVAESLISQMEECKPMDVVMRINSPGGSVFAGWGIIAKMKEMIGGVDVKVDGIAASMAAYVCLFASKVECLDVSTFLFHRASGNGTPEDQEFLDQVNGDLRSKLEAKIDGKKLKELKGISIKDLFESEKVIDLVLTAKEAKAIGLVDKINKVNPGEINAFNERMYAIAASAEPIVKPQPINKTMNIEKLKAEYPDVYAQVFALGVASEKDRVEACLVFNELDPKGVKEAIESGKPLTAKQTAEFGLKALSGAALNKIKEGAPAAVSTEETEAEKTEKQKTLTAFEAKVKASLNIK